MNIGATTLFVPSVPKTNKNWPVNWKIGPDGNSRPRRLYLAGPIRGIDDFERRFEYSAACVRSLGYKVFNPVEQDKAFERAGTPVDIRHCLKHDLTWICDWADGLALMNGWLGSRGVRAEFGAAEAIDIPTWELPDELQLP